MAKTSSTVLNRSGEGGILVLVLILGEEVFHPLTTNMMFVLGFPYMVFIMLKKLPSFPSLMSVFLLIFKYGKFYFSILYLIRYKIETLAQGHSFLRDVTNTL